MDSDGDILNNLLGNEDHEEDEAPAHNIKILKELDVNFTDTPSNVLTPSETIDAPINLNEGQSDSSDEEDRRYFEEQKYSIAGRDIKSLLKKTAMVAKECSPTFQRSNHTNSVSNTKVSIAKTSCTPQSTTDVYSDPIFGLRIVKPIVPLSTFRERMSGRTAVKISEVKHHITTADLKQDWVLAGVLINKSLTRTSQKGTQYCIWKISDLSLNMNTISLFLFSSAYKQLWKTSSGTVIGILNPNVMNNNDNIDQATLSIDNAQKLMILGNSKDMGTCKSVKKSGEPCTAIVNTHLCQYCTYHVQKEYSKCSRRAELQATGNGQKFSALNRLKNNNFPNKSNSLGSPVLNIAAAKKTRELREKDNARLALLMGEKMEKSETKHSGENKGLVQSNDLKKIQESRGWMKNTLMSNQSVTPTDSSMAGNILNKDTKKINLQLLQRSNAIIKSLKSNAAVKPISSPNNSIDFSEPITKKNINKAKLNALKWVQQHGSIKQANPNKIRPSEEDKTKLQTKRQRSDEDAVNDVKAKKAKSELDNFKKLMETTSAHVDLIERSNDENAEKYFNKLEVKEKMEEKMMSTFKVECKAVMCSICNYTALSSSDLCKEQGHPITVIKAVKRFFKCSDCGNRTISLDRMPNRSCKKCGSSSWSKAAMMNEKKVGLPGAKLSIRGDEETFINSGTNDANLDLLVPDTSS